MASEDDGREVEQCGVPHPEMGRECVKPDGHDGPHGAGFEGWNRGGHHDELTRVPFASKFLHPVVREDKNVTLRPERYGLEAGDRFIAANTHSSVEWALCEVTYTFTCPAWRAAEQLEFLDANHPLTETDQTAVEVLQPHYATQVTRHDILKGIVWCVVQPFAEVDDAE